MTDNPATEVKRRAKGAAGSARDGGGKMNQYPAPEWFRAMGYMRPRQLPDGRWIALQQMLFTVGLFVDITASSRRTRYCYPDYVSALTDLLSWDGQDDPPGLWIVQKPEQRYGPGMNDSAV